MDSFASSLLKKYQWILEQFCFRGYPNSHHHQEMSHYNS